MSLRAVVLTLALACVSLLGGLSPARGATIAQEDSFDLSTLSSGAQASACPCFCNYECFGATLTAPSEMQVRYIYLLYGITVGVSVNTAVDFYLFDNPSSVTPGAPFVDSSGFESIGQYLPMNFGGPAQLMEIDVLLSEVTPPVVGAGDEFTVAFCYNHVDELDVIQPNSGHGPAMDGDGTDTRNWIRALVGNPDSDCGNPQASYSWIQAPVAGDFIIRASDEPISWLQGGDDDDDDDDDDAVGDDDDTAGDDDDAVTGGPVILNITPNEMVQGTPVAVQIIGQNFDSSATAFIGGLALSSLELVSDQRLDGVAPQALLAQDARFDVTVSTTQGSNTLTSAFTVKRSGNASGCRSSMAGAGGLGAGLGVLLPAILARRRRR